MRTAHGKAEKDRRIFINYVLLAFNLVTVVMCILMQKNLASPSYVPIVTGGVVLLFLCWLFLVSMQNKETFISEEGVEERLFFGKLPYRKFQWSDFAYVGKLEIVNSHSQIVTYYVCSKTSPTREPGSAVCRVDPKKSVYIDYLDENRQLLAPYMRGLPC